MKHTLNEVKLRCRKNRSSYMLLSLWLHEVPLLSFLILRITVSSGFWMVFQKYVFWFAFLVGSYAFVFYFLFLSTLRTSMCPGIFLSFTLAIKRGIDSATEPFFVLSVTLFNPLLNPTCFFRLIPSSCSNFKINVDSPTKNRLSSFAHFFHWAQDLGNPHIFLWLDFGWIYIYISGIV